MGKVLVSLLNQIASIQRRYLAMIATLGIVFVSGLAVPAIETEALGNSWLSAGPGIKEMLQQPSPTATEDAYPLETPTPTERPYPIPTATATENPYPFGTPTPTTRISPSPTSASGTQAPNPTATATTFATSTPFGQATSTPSSITPQPTTVSAIESGEEVYIPLPSMTILFPTQSKEEALLQGERPPENAGLTKRNESSRYVFSRLGPIAFVLLIWVLLGGWLYFSARQIR